MMPVRIRDNFMGAGVDSVRFLREHEIYFEAPLRGPYSLWYYFALDGARGETIRFIQGKISKALGGGYFDTQVPVYSVDGRRWERVNPSDAKMDYKRDEFSFRLQADSDTVYVASCVPYTPNHWAEFMKHAGHLAKSVKIGVTAEGRDYYAAVIGRDDGQRKKLVVCSSQHHAGETPGSLVMDAALRDALKGFSDDPDLLDECVFLVIPFIDLDGAYGGRYGKDNWPVDFNRGWSYDSPRPELRAAQDMIDSYAARYDYALYTDFHAPTTGDVSYVVAAPASLVDEKTWDDIWIFAEMLAKRAENESPCRIKPLPAGFMGWLNHQYECEGASYQYIQHGAASFLLEATYNYASDGSLADKSAWDSLGRNWYACVMDLFIRGNRPVQFTRQTRCPTFKNWHLVHFPRQLEVTEEDDGICLTPTGGESDFFGTHNAFFPVGSDVKIMLEYDGMPATATIRVFYYRDGKKASQTDTVYYHLTKTDILQVGASHGTADKIRINVEVSNITSPLTIRLRES